MIVLAREVFLCKCATELPPDAPDAPDAAEASASARDLRFVRGDERHLRLLDPEHHGDDHARDFRSRLARGEHWLLGLVARPPQARAAAAGADGVVRERVATYTWLHARGACEYPYLPGCAFELPPEVAYGYDAWTPPELRGAGLRRRAFVEELRVLRSLGKSWEASFFVAHQLEGARRSLLRARIEVIPVWRVALGPGRRLDFEPLADPAGITPRAG